MSHISIQNENKRLAIYNYNRYLQKDDYLIFEDDFGRKWRLTPITNPNIQLPFIIKPLPMEIEK